MRKISIMIPAVMLAAQTVMAQPTDRMFVNSRNGLNVRSGPGIESEILDVLPFGSEVQALDFAPDNDWYKIRYGGKTAYVATEFIQYEDPFQEMEYLGNWRTTAYAYTGSPCANGNYPQAGYTIACNVLPFGTEVYISGVGFRTVEDRGPSWLGMEWLDIYMDDANECVQWGEQYRDVYLVGNHEADPAAGE